MLSSIGRSEPVQIPAGQNASNITVPYSIAALSIDNFGEYFVFISPANRPGFWISPYQTKTIVNLNPPASYINVSQMIDGPNGVSGAISSGGTGTVDMLLWDTPQSSQAGIISSPPATIVTAILNVWDSGSPFTIFTVPATFNAIIKKLAASNRSYEISATDILLSDMSLSWASSGVDPARFRWYQSISPETPYATDDFDEGAAVIKSGLNLQVTALLDVATYYTSAHGPEVEVLSEYYLVLA